MKKALIIGDLHIPYEDIDAVKIVFNVIENNKFDEIVLAGDVIDCAQLSKFLNYEDTELELYEEIELFKLFIKYLKKISNNTKIIYLEDNHFSERLHRYLLEHNEIKKFVKIKLPVDKIVEYNIPYFPLKQNKIAVIHGYNANKYFAEKYTREFPHSIIVAHTHTMQHYCSENTLECYGIGCLCKSMKYLRNKPNRWRKGFGVLYYDKNYKNYWFNNIEIKNNCCIFEGKIYQQNNVNYYR